MSVGGVLYFHGAIKMNKICPYQIKIVYHPV